MQKVIPTGGTKMENEKLFELMTKMYSEMQEGFKKSDKRFDNLEGRFDNLEGRFDNLEDRFDNLESDVKKIGAQIDGEITPKLEALFDGYKQNTEKLTRIENEVSRHEEVILRRVK